MSDNHAPLFNLNSTRLTLPSLSLALALAVTLCVVKKLALLLGAVADTEGATLGALTSVSYTHLTLPTKA